jgi:hypothetical protein
MEDKTIEEIIAETLAAGRVIDARTNKPVKSPK